LWLLKYIVLEPPEYRRPLEVLIGEEPLPCGVDELHPSAWFDELFYLVRKARSLEDPHDLRVQMTGTRKRIFIHGGLVDCCLHSGLS
jgi:hypothetical protein